MQEWSGLESQRDGQRATPVNSARSSGWHSLARKRKGHREEQLLQYLFLRLQCGYGPEQGDLNPGIERIGIEHTMLPGFLSSA